MESLVARVAPEEERPSTPQQVTDTNGESDPPQASGQPSAEAEATDSVAELLQPNGGKPATQTPPRVSKWKGKAKAVGKVVVADKQAKETFGVQAGQDDLTGHRDEQPLPWYLVDLESKFRMYWDFMQVIVLSYVALVVPLRVAFTVKTWGVAFWVDVLVDVYFYIDIVVGFLTIVKVEVDDMDVYFIRDMRGIASVYLRGWFIIDVLACLPLDYVERSEEGTLGCSFKVFGCGDSEDQGSFVAAHNTSAGTDGNGVPSLVPGTFNATVSGEDGAAGGAAALKLLKLLRIFRLLKLMRLARVKRILDRYQDKMVYYGHLLTCSKVGAVLVILSHWLGCMYGAVYTDWHEDETLTEKWIACFYWAVQTITTVGYGDFTQDTVPGMLMSAFAMLVGGVVFSWFMSSVFSLINPDPVKEKQQETMQYVVTYLKTNNLPATTTARVLNFFRKTSSTYHFNEEEMLLSLPFVLRQEIFDYLYGDILRSIPLFRSQEEHFINQLALAVRLNIVPPFEFLYRCGQTDGDFHVLVFGEISILATVNRKHILNNVLSDHSELEESTVSKFNAKGSYFGEGSVLGCKQRTENALCTRAEDGSKVLQVPTVVLLELFEVYPDVQKEMLNKFIQRTRAFAVVEQQRQACKQMRLEHLLEPDRGGIKPNFRALLEASPPDAVPKPLSGPSFTRVPPPPLAPKSGFTLDPAQLSQGMVAASSLLGPIKSLEERSKGNLNTSSGADVLRELAGSPLPAAPELAGPAGAAAALKDVQIAELMAILHHLSAGMETMKEEMSFMRMSMSSLQREVEQQNEKSIAGFGAKG